MVEGRADDSKGPAGCGGARGGRGARGGWRGVSGGPRWNRWSSCSPERKRTEELKGSRSLMEPEGRGVAGGVESWSNGWSTTDQGRAGGMREPSGASGLMATLERRELGAMVEPLGWRAEALRSWRQRRGILQPQRWWRLADPRCSHWIDGGLRVSSDDSSGGGRSGRAFLSLRALRASNKNSGMEALSVLVPGTRALSGRDSEMEALSGPNLGTGALFEPKSGEGALSGLILGTEALFGLSLGTEALSGPTLGTETLSGLNFGTGAHRSPLLAGQGNRSPLLAELRNRVSYWAGQGNRTYRGLRWRREEREQVSI